LESASLGLLTDAGPTCCTATEKLSIPRGRREYATRMWDHGRWSILLVSELPYTVSQLPSKAVSVLMHIKRHDLRVICK
jgi:hypothetical protein